MLADKIKDSISDLILSGEFTPGMRMDEQALASRFGVSRTPIREAIQHLAAAGLVECQPRRSAVVRSLSATEIEDSFEAIAEIEGICVFRAAERMTEVERMRLRNLVEQAEPVAKNGDGAAYRALDAQFHELLHQGAHNATIAGVAADLRLRTGPYSAAPYTLPESKPELLTPHRQHVEIVDAILDRDPHAARQACIVHVSTSVLTIQRYLAETQRDEPARRTA
ncbi:GntR family transcriptional regulator [Salipiger sp. IMCC34102]|uniref:GntR family transcriptional regulator n=1 Tax=Salipiger sp. IMCC34102 TaxID=2510647 RepID=UPI0013ECB716|nr:GntR family transcriptional regulator [Salipiger sp. IMCC34102]